MTMMKEKAAFYHNWKPHSKSFLEVFDVGSVDGVKGKLDGKDYNIFCMKEPDHVCEIFKTAGG